MPVVVRAAAIQVRRQQRKRLNLRSTASSPENFTRISSTGACGSLMISFEIV